MASKSTFKRKSTARGKARKGQRVYKVKGGWRISSGTHARHNGWHRVGGRRRKTRRRR